MNIIDRYTCRLFLIVSLFCTLAFCSSLTTSTSVAQEILRLPNFSISQVQPEIDKGSAEAFYILGTLYYKGQNGVKLNYKKSAEMFRRAAEQGLALAQLHLGEMYYDGTRIPQNDSEAFRWYQVAALQGLPQAENGLAKIYAEGRGTAVNPKEAARWYMRAAMQGYGEAQHQVGIYYANGTGLSADLVKSYEWLSLASTQGVIEAISSRDEIRNRLTKQQIANAQRSASIFKATPHYNLNELNNQESRIRALSKEILKAK